jgi:WD40 repeat protein
MPRFNTFVCVLILLLLATGCSVPASSELAALPTLPATSTPLSTITLVRSATPTFTITVSVTPTLRKTTVTPRPTRTISPSKTPTPTIPVSTVTFIGTPLPVDIPVIGKDNIRSLTWVSQWGKGILLEVAFAPQGGQFVAGSAFGIAIYDVLDPERAPRWLPFQEPQSYQTLEYSLDGKYIRLVKEKSVNYSASKTKETALRLSDGVFVEITKDMQWLSSPQKSTGYDSISSISPDGRMEFRGGLTYMSLEEAEKINMWTEELAFREMVDTASGEPIFTFSDPVRYVSMDDRSSPEGCDLDYFSPCGNATLPLATAPGRVLFAPSGDLFAILYSTPSMWTDRFNYLRLYAASDGKLLTTIGGFDRPVRSFAFGPDSNSLLVGYLDGSLQLWDIKANQVIQSVAHFNTTLYDIAFTHDGEFLVMMRAGEVEIRRRSDGSLRSNLAATAFAISPIDSILAVGDREGKLRIIDIESGQTLQRLEGHTALIYSLSFSPDGSLLVSSSRDCSVRAWDVQSGKFLHFFESFTAEPYEGLERQSRIFVFNTRFIPGTDQLIGFGSWGTALSWGIQSGARKYVVESAPLEYYQGMITLEQHFPEYFAVDTNHSRFYINEQGYDLHSGAILDAYVPPPGLPKGCGPSGPITADGKLKFTLGYESREGQICVLDATNYGLVDSIRVIRASSDDDYLNDLYILWMYLSPDGKQLYVPLSAGVVNIYQIAHR